jgi:hypothetical protein
MSWRSCRIAGYWPLLSRGLSGPRSTCQSAARSLLSSPHTPHHTTTTTTFHQQNTSHSLAHYHSASTDASNEITIYSTLQVSNSLCANAGLQDKYTYETRHLESFHPHCGLRPRSALDSATAFRPGPANGLIIAPFPDFLFLLDPMSYDY